MRQLLSQHSMSQRWFADEIGRNRISVSQWVNGHVERPHTDALHAIEDLCEMPRGTVAAVIDGRLSPDEGVARFGMTGRSDAPADVDFRLRNLEAQARKIDDLETTVAQLHARTSRIQDALHSMLSHLPDSPVDADEGGQHTS